MIARLPTPAASSFGYFWSPRLARRVREELATRSYDLIFVHCSSAAPYVLHSNVPKILDFGDMDSQKWLDYAKFKPFPLSMGYRLEGLKLQRVEKALARRFGFCTCTTRAELETLEEFATGARCGWFPNGVDAERFKPADTPYDPDTIVFIGRMDYYPNQECMTEFCSRVLPAVRERRPEVRLFIVGANPSPAMRALERLPGVTVTGTVPEVQPYVHRAALTVAPLNIARGTQNKILESLAMGVPSVCSRLAAKGVDAVPGEHLLAADTPEEYVEAIVSLLTDGDRRARFSEAGRARMLSHHSWPGSLRRMEALIEERLAGVPDGVAEGVA